MSANKECPWASNIKDEGIEKILKDISPSALSDMKEVACAVNAPPHLAGYIPAIHNFSKILPALIDLAEGELADDFTRWRIEIDKCLQQNDWSKTDPEFLSYSHRPYCLSNPLYVVLLTFDKFNIPEPISQIFTAHFYLSFRDNWLNMTQNTRSSAGLAFRSIQNGRGFSPALFERMYQNIDTSSREALASSLADIEMRITADLESGKVDLRPAITSYIRTLHLLFSNEIGKKGGGGSGNKGGGSSRLKELELNIAIPTYYSEVNSELIPKDISQHYDLGRPQREAAMHYGLALGDATTSRNAVTDLKPMGLSNEVVTDASYRKLRQKKIEQAIAIGNQFTATQWNQLNAYELYVLANELQKLSSDFTDIDGIPKRFLAAAIAISFARGNSMECILDTRVVRKRIKGACNHILIKKHNDGWDVQWLISADHIKDGRKTRWEMHNKSRSADHNPSVELAAPEWVANIVGCADDLRIKAKLSKRKTYLFTGKPSDYIAATQKWLKIILKKYPACRLSQMRIENYFVQFCMQNTKFDLAETAYAHGNIHLIQQTQLYYTAVPKTRVAYVYKQLWMQIDRAIQRESIAIEGESIIRVAKEQISMGDFINETSFLGSKITPLSKSVSSLVEFLKHNLESASQMSTFNGQRLIAYHNAYTAYTIFFLAYASGYRAAQDPFPDPRFLDPKTGFLVISDKDFDDAYCTRIIWLPSECVQQLLNYERHFRSVLSRLSLFNNKSYLELYNSIDAWMQIPKSPRKRQRMKEFQAPPYMFFIDDKYNCTPVQPGELQSIASKIFPFPINANRHYLRTELLERKCSSDILDAFLGHWHRGRESWGQFSSLSPRGFIRSIAPKLEELLRANRWKAIKSIES